MMSEAEIQRDIELALGVLPGVIVLRNSVGKALHVREDTGKAYHVPYGLGPGSPDLLILLAPWGRLCALEVKVPGRGPDRHQERCHRAWRAVGVHVEVVHSAREALTALERAQSKACVWEDSDDDLE